MSLQSQISQLQGYQVSVYFVKNNVTILVEDKNGTGLSSLVTPDNIAILTETLFVKTGEFFHALCRALNHEETGIIIIISKNRSLIYCNENLPDNTKNNLLLSW